MKSGHVFAAVFLGWVLIGLGCSRATPPIPARDFAIEDLLVPLAEFPAGWQVVGSPEAPAYSDGDILAAESIRVAFAGGDNGSLVAKQWVHRFRWPADDEFRDRLPIEFNSSSVASLSPWETPPELPYQSAVADQAYFACHINGVGTPKRVCQFMGQYGEFLVIFHTVMGEQMTFADLEALLEAIDELMATHLEEGATD